MRKVLSRFSARTRAALVLLVLSLVGGAALASGSAEFGFTGEELAGVTAIVTGFIAVAVSITLIFRGFNVGNKAAKQVGR
jgi:hypothetical protein